MCCHVRNERNFIVYLKLLCLGIYETNICRFCFYFYKFTIFVICLKSIGQENMLNVPFIEITSTGFIADPCPKNGLL